MLETEFMRLAFATGAVVGLLAPAVGFFLVQRNMSLVGDGVGHTAFAGVAAGYLLGVSPVLTALVAAVAGAVGIEWLRSRHRAAGDQALALLFYTGLAAGVVLASSAGALDVDLFSFLFGSILTVTRGDLVLVVVLGVAGLVLIGLLYRALAAVVIDEEGARVAGVPVAALNVLVAGLAGVTIGLSMRIVGILLIAALMVLPVIAAGPRRLEHELVRAAGDGHRAPLRLRRTDGRVLRRSPSGRGDRPPRSGRVRRHERRSKPSARGRDPYAHASGDPMIEGWKRALVLAPHTDDGEFGCGGTMARLVEAGTEVRYVAFSIATKSLPEGFPPDTLAREVREATAEIGIPESGLVVHDFEVRTFPERRQEILELLIALWEEWAPDAVFMPSLRDIHQDHQVIAAEGLRAFKRTTVLGYEIPWNNFNFDHQAYVGLEERHVERKVAALARYASQQHRNYANPEYVWSLARTHGINVNREYAEVFEVYRIVT